MEIQFSKDTDRDDIWVGRRIGVYRIVAEIGRGGMSAVYKAVRDDGDHDKQVAIKLLRGGAHSRELLERFRLEKQVLAHLDHPNIARLLDGGSTAEGLPYLVIDYIVGQPIDQYCVVNRLGVRQRLELFRTLCDAVQHVHQHLMVHGDLKCGNVLVRVDGTVKLLDFGIARLLTPPEPVDSTPTTVAPLTPEYASPEQIRGGPLTTASDVYSLGIVLFRLLTGVLPLRTCEAGLPNASVVARSVGNPETAGFWRALRGDLDNIIAMALQEDAAQRYASVEEFAADVECYLSGLPVKARTTALPSRVAKFLRRNRAGAAAASLIIVSLIGGVIATNREAYRAHMQRAEAERRFNDVRVLASSLMFDIHDSIRFLPGAARSRRLLIDTIVRYLDGLSEDAAGDPKLEDELAAAYYRLADAQGQVRGATGEDFSGAAGSYRHAIALWQASLSARPSDEQARSAVVGSYVKLSDVMWVRGDSGAALSYSREAVANAVPLQTSRSAPSRYVAAVAWMNYGYELFKIKGDITTALNYMGRSVREAENAWTPGPAYDRVDYAGLTLGRLYALWGEILCYVGRYTEALLAEEKSRQTYMALLSASPNDAQMGHMTTFADYYTAKALMNLGRLEEAAGYEDSILRALEPLLATNPTVADYQGEMSGALAGLAEIAERQGRLPQALQLLQRALQELAAAPGAQSTVIFRDAQAIAQFQMGEVYAKRCLDEHRTNHQRQADLRSAKAWYLQARAVSEGLSDALYEATERVKKIDVELAWCDRQLAVRASR